MVKDKVKEVAQNHLKDAAIGVICQKIWDKSIEKSTKADDSILDKIEDAVDLFNVKGMMTSCKDTSDSNGAVDCAKNVLEGLSTFDPTGLLTIAAAFMKPSCTVTRDIITITQDSPFSVTINPSGAVPSTVAPTVPISSVPQAKKGCLLLFDQCGLKGNRKEVCASTTELNFNASSMITGEGTNILMFNKTRYNGDSILFAGSNTINCFKDVKLSTTDNFDKQSASIFYNPENCLTITVFVNSATTPVNYETHIFCQTKTKGFGTITFPSDSKTTIAYLKINIPPKVKVSFYKDENLAGTPWMVITQSATVMGEDLKKWVGKALKSEKLEITA